VFLPYFSNVLNNDVIVFVVEVDELAEIPFHQGNLLAFPGAIPTVGVQENRFVESELFDEFEDDLLLVNDAAAAIP
jgi:hypothetical protein